MGQTSQACNFLADEQKTLAATVNEARLGRGATALIITALIGVMVSPWPAALWLSLVIGGETWQWRSARALLVGKTETKFQKLQFIAALGFNNMAWSALGNLIWTINGGACQAIALSVWVTQFMLAALYAFRSKAGYVTTTLPPLIGLLIAIAPWASHLTYTRALTITGMALGPAFAFLTARQAAHQRRQMQAALSSLEASETRFRTLANSVTDVIIQLSPTGERLYVSPSIQDLIGISPEDYIRRDGKAQILAEDIERVMSVWAQVRDGGRPRSVECRALCADNSIKWLESSYTAVNHGDGPGPHEVVVVMRDVGARKAIEHELAKAAADAAAAAAAKTEFLANMSHELRTPLTAILGFSDLLKKSEALSVADARNAERINSASQTLLTVVNDVLDFSKMEAGALELNIQPLDLVDLLQGTLDLISAPAEAKGLVVRLETEGEILPVVGDPIRLRQILLNLCSNALKFTSAGEIVGRVKFGAPTDGICPIRLEICDTGIGIDENKRRLMFERFFQADGSISRQYGGTGLGLAICKQLVSLMKGRIDVDSALGRGSVFWFELSLPVADSLHVGLDPTPSPMANDVAARVLVAEDHPVNQELIRLILQAAGIEVHIVGDGAQAVQAVQTMAFDLILMDIQMPVMGGPEATRRIRAQDVGGRSLPIIAMTANVMPEQVAAYLAAGMDAHLGKPIDAQALIATIAHWIERGRTGASAEIKTADVG